MDVCEQALLIHWRNLIAAGDVACARTGAPTARTLICMLGIS